MPAAAATDFIVHRHSMSRVKWLLAIVAAIYIAIIVRNISYVAGGPDESGYMNEARMFSSGRTHIDVAPLRTLNLDPSFTEVFTPLGFSPRPNGTMVAVYPPGYPIHLLAASTLGGWKYAPFFVIPLAAFGAIALTYAIARELGLEPPFAAASAAILAVHPTFMLHSIVVMSDVLATFWALLAVWLSLRRTQWGAGVLTGAAFAIGVWVRPTNLLVAIPLLIALRFRFVRAALGAIPFGIALMVFNAKTYGSPLATGYGSAAVFSFGDCFWEQLRMLSHLVSPAVVLCGLFAVFDKRASGWTRALLFAWFSSFLIFYGCWQVCGNWTLTRFLLPATPALIIGAVFVIRDIPWPRLVAAIVILAILGYSIDKCHKRHVLTVDEDQVIYPRSIALAQRVIPRDAMIVTGLLSGAYFNYANELTVRWDTLDAGRFAALRAKNAKWYAVLSQVEVDMNEFRRRLPGHWTPVASYRNVIVYRLEP